MLSISSSFFSNINTSLNSTLWYVFESSNLNKVIGLLFGLSPNLDDTYSPSLYSTISIFNLYIFDAASISASPVI